MGGVLVGRRRAARRVLRQEIDVLLDVLGCLEGSRRGSWEIVTLNNLNSDMWRRYRAKMLDRGLIRGVDLGRGGIAFEITPMGRGLLSIIKAYRSIWPQ